MNVTEFSNQFDVLFSNITSNQAPGLNEYEKSVFLTKAQNEIVKNYFTANSRGNNIGQGFDDSAKRQADFSCLMKTLEATSAYSENGAFYIKKYTCSNYDDSQSEDLYSLKFSTGVSPSIGVYEVVEDEEGPYITIDGEMVFITGFPYNEGTLTVTKDKVTVSGKIDLRSQLYAFPTDIFIIINEAYFKNNEIRQIIPLRYDEYTRLMSKPYKRPLKNQAWRLINTGTVNGENSTRYAEIITCPNEEGGTYLIRYIRFPRPIIVGDIDGLTINGYPKTAHYPVECELDPIIHEDILQRAVELAKIAWTSTGQDNAQMVLAAGQRSE